jgi:hypothetical protein
VDTFIFDKRLDRRGRGEVTHLVRLGDGADALDVHVDGDLHRGACEAANKAVSH